MPAGVRATRSQTISGFLRRDQHLGGFAIAAESPCGGITGSNLGMRRLPRSRIGFSCSSPSSARNTGPIGGVVAIL